MKVFSKKKLNFCKIAKVHPDHVTAIISYGIQKDGHADWDIWGSNSDNNYGPQNSCRSVFPLYNNLI